LLLDDGTALVDKPIIGHPMGVSTEGQVFSPTFHGWLNGEDKDLIGTIALPDATITVTLENLRLQQTNGMLAGKITISDSGKAALLLPFAFFSDLNNDGITNSSDARLKMIALSTAADDQDKERAIEYMFVNDNLSNGLWDVEDAGDSTGGATRNRPSDQTNDDDTQEIALKCDYETGAVWFEYDEGGDQGNTDTPLSHLQFYRTAECTAEVTFPFVLSAQNKLPKKLYVRTKQSWAPTEQIAGRFVMNYGAADQSKIWGADEMPLTIVAKIGDAKYFQAARDYVMENNAPFHVRDWKKSGVSVRVVSMREEATHFYALDIRDTKRFTALPPLRMAAMIAEPFVQDHSVIINGVIMRDTSPLGRPATGTAYDRIWGRLIATEKGSTYATYTQPDTTGVNWSTVASFVQTTAKPGCIFQKGNMPDVSYGWPEQTGELFFGPGENTGDEVYIGKRVEEPVGATSPTFKPMLFVAVGLGGPSWSLFTQDLESSGVVDGPASEGAAAKKLWQCDGGGSLALAVRRPSVTAFSIERASPFRHGLISNERVNNYLSFKCDLPR
jgi:hypothetical protein